MVYDAGRSNWGHACRRHSGRPRGRSSCASLLGGLAAVGAAAPPVPALQAGFAKRVITPSLGAGPRLHGRLRPRPQGDGRPRRPLRPLPRGERRAPEDRPLRGRPDRLLPPRDREDAAAAGRARAGQPARGGEHARPRRTRHDGPLGTESHDERRRSRLPGAPAPRIADAAARGPVAPCRPASSPSRRRGRPAWSRTVASRR